MKRIGKKASAVLLMVLMAIAFMPNAGIQSAYAEDEPAAIQDTYDLDGVTYFNVGSEKFAGDKLEFYADMLGTRSSDIKLRGEYDYDEYDYKYYDQSEADLWLQLGTTLLTDLEPRSLIDASRPTMLMYNAAVRGTDSYDQGNGMTYQATRYDVAGKESLKEAEEWVFQKTLGSKDQDFGQFKDDSTNQPVLAAAVNVNEMYNGTTDMTYTIAAYFTNFRVSALIPSDEGSNYVTEIITDKVNSESTTASTVKNLTASTVTGSQSVSNSITASVSNSISGSETHSKSNTKKVGAEFTFKKVLKIGGDISWTEGEAFSTGWGSSDSITKSQSASYTVSIPMSPYTQAMITQTDSTTVAMTKYNCPIALLYDVTIVGYQKGRLGDGIMHTYDTQIYVDGEWISIDRYVVFSFADALEGARGDLSDRIQKCDDWNEMDEEGLRWYHIKSNADNQYDLHTAPDSIAAVSSHAPVAPTGAAYTQTLNIVASEVSGLMPTHPLYRVKIAEPSLTIHSDEVSYQLFDYYTANMKVGDYSYANYLNLVGFNRYDVPFYGFSKDNGYWIITDKEGNELDPADSPVLLEKDPVSTNWRYTAVKPGTCFMVYRIDEDAYSIADDPEHTIKNEDLKKTAALEIVVTEKEGAADHEHQMVKTKRKAPTCTELGNIEYYTCSVCDGIFGDKAGTEELCEGDIVIPALGHKWSEWETVKEAGEEEEGLESRFCCNDPSHQQTRAIPALPHKHVMVKTGKTLPTCTKEGNILHYTCSVCGRVFTDYEGSHEIDPLDVVLPATGHSWDAGKVTKAPTTTATGTKECTCTKCGETKTVIVDKVAKSANPLKVSGKTATVKYSKLKKANRTLAASKVIAFTKKADDKKNYTLSSAKKGTKSFKKYFAINKTTGKVTVKKGLQKGTYKVVVKVKALGNSKYMASGAKSVTVTVKVK